MTVASAGGRSKSCAATGELGDMLSHRIDYGFFLLGLIRRIVARLRIFIPQRGGQPADVDDYVSMLGDFEAAQPACGRAANSPLAGEKAPPAPTSAR